MSKLLIERMAFPKGCTIGGTAETPVIEGVLLCGPVSANRRRYLKKAFEGDRINRYNGAPVGSYHADARTGRRYLDQFGTVQNARHRPSDGMPIGDIHLNPEKPGAKALLWDAKHQPAACSMSHVAHCETTTGSDGFEEVHEVVKVESVDVCGVGDAATTTSLQENRGGSSVPLTVKQLTEALVKHKLTKSKQVKALKSLGEMDGMDGAPSSMDAPPGEDDAGGHEAAVDSAFESAGCAIWKAFTKGEIEMPDVIKKLKELAKGHGNVKGSKGAADDGDDDDDSDDTETEESKKKGQKTADPIAVLQECRAAGFEPKANQLKYLCTLSEADRKADIAETAAEHKTATGGGNRPTGATRRPGAGGAGNTTTKTEQTTGAGQAMKIPKFDEI